MQQRRAIKLLCPVPALLLLAYVWWYQTRRAYDLVELSAGVHDLRSDKNAATPGPLPNAPGVGLAVQSGNTATRYPRYDAVTGYTAWTEFRGPLATGRAHAFLAYRGKTIDLGTLGGKSSVVHGVNAAGHVIGWSFTWNHQAHAFLWRDGKMLDLGTLPGGRTSYANAINDRDEVVGQANTKADAVHAFLWREGQMHDLGALPHGTESNALALNNRGQIVGWAIPEDGAFHAVAWKEGKIADLNRLVRPRAGLLLEQALSIDEQGRIEVHGSRKGQWRAFRLVPR